MGAQARGVDDLGGQGGAFAQALIDQLALLGGVGPGLFGQAGGALGLAKYPLEAVALDVG